MMIKIGDKLFDSQTEPVAILLDTASKEIISKMPPGHSIFLSVPSAMGQQQGWEWYNREPFQDAGRNIMGPGSRILLPADFHRGG